MVAGTPTVRLTLEQAQQLQWMTQSNLILPDHPKFHELLNAVKRPDLSQQQAHYNHPLHYIYRPGAYLPELADDSTLNEYFYDGEYVERCRQVGNVPVSGLTEDQEAAFFNGEEVIDNKGRVEV